MAAGRNRFLSNRPAVCTGISLLAACAVAGMAGLPFMKALELKALDFMFALRGRAEAPEGIAVVEIDEKTVAQFGYPVPRMVQTWLMEALNGAGVTAAGYDIIFDKPSSCPDFRQDDIYFAEEVERAPFVTLAAGFTLAGTDSAHRVTVAPGGDAVLKFGYGFPGNTVPPGIARAVGVLHPYDRLLEAVPSLAQVNVPPDPDGIHRRVPLFVEYGGRCYPNLGLELAMRQLGVRPGDAEFTPEGTFRIRTAGRTINIPLDGAGNMLINYFGDRYAFKRYSALALLKDMSTARKTGQPARLLRELEGKTVLVGQTAAAVGDIGPTPFDREDVLVFMHANICAGVLAGRFVRPSGRGTDAAAVAALCLLTGLMLAFVKTRLQLPAVLAVIAGYWGLGLALFSGGTWIGLMQPSLAVLLAYFSCFLWIYFVVEKNERFVKHVFGKYVSDEVLQMMKEKDLAAAGERKELTILFSDVKGFSKISDEADPEQLVLQLKEYFDEMTRIIFKYDGFLDKFMGDGIMAFFNDPRPRSDHALCGVKAAWEMQQSMQRLREKWTAEGKTPFQIRIGLNTGVAAVGNLGSTQKFTYTAFGSAVNVASRMESSGRPDGVQVTDRVYAATRDEIEYEDAGEITVKNIMKPVKVYFVKGLKHA